MKTVNLNEKVAFRFETRLGSIVFEPVEWRMAGKISYQVDSDLLDYLHGQLRANAPFGGKSFNLKSTWPENIYLALLGMGEPFCVSSGKPNPLQAVMDFDGVGPQEYDEPMHGRYVFEGEFGGDRVRVTFENTGWNEENEPLVECSSGDIDFRFLKLLMTELGFGVSPKRASERLKLIEGSSPDEAPEDDFEYDSEYYEGLEEELETADRTISSLRLKLEAARKEIEELKRKIAEEAVDGGELRICGMTKSELEKADLMSMLPNDMARLMTMALIAPVEAEEK